MHGLHAKRGGYPLPSFLRIFPKKWETMQAHTLT